MQSALNLNKELKTMQKEYAAPQLEVISFAAREAIANEIGTDADELTPTVPVS